MTSQAPSAHSESARTSQQEPTEKPFLSPQITSYFVAGGLAGAASRTVVSPLERLKIIQCVQSFSSY